MIRISTDEKQDFEVQHENTLRSLAPECMLFLRRNGDFPLTEPGKIALYGSGARNTIKGGTGSGDVNSRSYTTIEQGLENAGFEITTKSWLFQYDLIRRRARGPWVEDLTREAKRRGENPAVYAMGAVMPEPEYELPIKGDGDTAVYVLSRISGEGSDRKYETGDFLLSDTEKRDIRTIAEKYPKFLLVLNVGGPVDLTEIPGVENILLLSQLGMVTGDAFADVLLGKADPSGKLATTWAAGCDYQKIGSFDEEDDTRYKEGIYVGYRYFDSAKKTPAFPFGFGLSYTDFEIRTDPESGFSLEDGGIRVRATVKNTGYFAGKETLQLYYSAPAGRLDQPYQQLGAYEKTDLIPAGESREVSVFLPVENMASYDMASASWILEKGDYVLRLGDSSRHTEPVGVLRLSEDLVVEKDKNIGGHPDFEDWRPKAGKDPAEDLSGVQVIAAGAGDLAGFGPYDRNRRAKDEAVSLGMAGIDLSGFSDEELAKTCIGKFNDGKGATVLIGDQGASVPGTAGESADVIQDKGFGKLILSDGPAGLRLAPSYVATDKGNKALGNDTLAMVSDFLPKAVQFALRKKSEAEKKKYKDTPVYHQYASAIPIGTALAQSWNMDLVRTCGEIVGDEMERFGVNVWLAPALNIHRSVFCGRNFEYYSEDPVVAGRTAAAMVQGVQAHAKCAATIKHFACNNQEFNRTHSCSQLSERALREIYLKGFEICVKEAQPHFLMTSYNLINGVHTANRADLLTEVLRGEWGFEGVVMTDWYTTTDISPVKKERKYGNSVPSECIAAGNDMIEPGTPQDYEQILRAVRGEDPTHPLDREQLEASARRILYWADQLS